MARNVACQSLGVLLLGAGPVVANAGDEPAPPLLMPPALTPPAPTTDVPPTVGRTPVKPIENRPMLVIPGVNSPGRVHSRVAPLPAFEPAGPARPDFGPALIGPSGPDSSPGPESARRSVPRPPTLPTPTLPLTPTSALHPSLTRESGSESAPNAPKPPAAPSARRSPSVFGRFLPAPLSAGRGGGNRSAVTVEPSTDPAAEAAMKRRLERQIQESLGSRVRDVEVRIVGRDVTIRARATRFWQRRTVRRALEALPGLAGYRPTVEIIE